MIILKELRCGNIFNYHTAEGEILPTTIDWQDMKWLTEDPKGFNLVHSPVPLTDDIMLQFGFQLFPWGWVKQSKNNFEVRINLTSFGFGYDVEGNYPVNVAYLHRLQNLYFDLTGENLEVMKTGWSYEAS